MEVLIVTKDREENLLRCVKSITQNSILPKSVVIVKSKEFKNLKNKTAIKNILATKGIKFVYKKVQDRGISYSRNIALSLVKGDQYAFLDDDEFCSKNWVKMGLDTLKKHPDVAAATGYKAVYYKNNYWNLVWQEIYKASENASFYTEFATSSNTFYKTALIKKHNITYDNDFKTSSEDFVFCQKLKRSGLKIWFNYKIRVTHKFRNSMIGIIKQWFDYGLTIYKFKKKYIKKISKYNFPIKDFIFQMKNIKKYRPLMLPGLGLIQLSLLMGYIYGKIEDLYHD